MTKRPSPFEFDFSRQYKIHVSNFENDLKALENVRGKTIKKLIDGSKKSHSIVSSSKDSISGGDVFPRSSNFLQKCDTSVRKRITIKNEKISNCSFCDSNKGPVYECIRCLEFYCHACSLIVYGSFEDKRVCLSCS